MFEDVSGPDPDRSLSTDRSLDSDRIAQSDPLVTTGHERTPGTAYPGPMGQRTRPTTPVGDRGGRFAGGGRGGG